MLVPLIVVPAFLLAGVLVASGIAKLRHPDDLAGWAELGVPAALRRKWLLRVHPWGELVLAVALVVLGGVLGVLAALACLALMSAYLWLIATALAKARRSAADPSCSCFGQPVPISSFTVVRNVWLVALAVLAVVGLGSAPALGGAVAVLALSGGWLWLGGLAAAAVTTALVLWSERGVTESVLESSDSQTRAADATESDLDELDYIRTRTPAVPVTLADGTLTDLRALSMAAPVLVMAVSPTCGPCQPVIDAVPEWRTRLPEVAIRFLLAYDPGEGAFAETTEPQSLHDAKGFVSRSFSDFGTPTAVLLGADGMLAGGPVAGYAAIEDFVAEIRASLDEFAQAAASAS